MLALTSVDVKKKIQPVLTRYEIQIDPWRQFYWISLGVAHNPDPIVKFSFFCTRQQAVMTR